MGIISKYHTDIIEERISKQKWAAVKDVAQDSANTVFYMPPSVAVMKNYSRRGSA